MTGVEIALIVIGVAVFLLLLSCSGPPLTSGVPDVPLPDDDWCDPDCVCKTKQHRPPIAGCFKCGAAPGQPCDAALHS